MQNNICHAYKTNTGKKLLNFLRPCTFPPFLHCTLTPQRHNASVPIRHCALAPLRLTTSAPLDTQCPLKIIYLCIPEEDSIIFFFRLCKIGNNQGKAAA
jgi:hypothetical protein